MSKPYSLLNLLPKGLLRWTSKLGFNQIAALFTMVAQIEKEHEERYRALAENLKNQKVFAREEQQLWQCRNCGYTFIGKSAPLKCPVCAHPQSYFELKKINY